jgi:hypothetical protein
MFGEPIQEAINALIAITGISITTAVTLAIVVIRRIK